MKLLQWKNENIIVHIVTGEAPQALFMYNGEVYGVEENLVVIASEEKGGKQIGDLLAAVYMMAGSKGVSVEDRAIFDSTVTGKEIPISELMKIKEIVVDKTVVPETIIKEPSEPSVENGQFCLF